MTTLTFAYNHSRDPMNPVQLADQIATSLALTTLPTVDINPTQIIVTHQNVTSGNTAAIQSLINAYVFDPVWAGGVTSVLLGKATTALTTNATALALPDPTAANNTYIALASPTVSQTNAQVKALSNQANALRAQVQALTRQNDVLIRLAANLLDSTSGT